MGATNGATTNGRRGRTRARRDEGSYVEELTESLAGDRKDGWYNLTTGIGTSRDKAAQHTFVADALLSDTTLEALFGCDDFAQRIVAAPIEEAMKLGFSVAVLPTADPAEDEPGEGAELGAAIAEAIEGWQLADKITEAAIWGRLFGGGAIWVGADDGRSFAEPLDEGRIRTIQFLRVLDRRSLSVRSVYGGLARAAGEPETYWVHPIDGTPTTAAQGSSLGVVHESRLIVFRGARTTRYRRAQLGGWDDSVLRKCYAILLSAAQNWQSICHLMADLSQAVFSIKNLAAQLKAKQRAAVEERLELVDKSRSTARAIAIDADGEKFERTSSQLTGVPELFDRTNIRVAATAQMPVTVLLGQSPTGFDATGNADFQGWYDTCDRVRTHDLTPRVRRVVLLLLAAKDGPTAGRVPERVRISWPPLWRGTPKDQAAIAEQRARRNVAYVQAGIYDADEVALAESGDASDVQIDRGLRRERLRATRSRKLEAAKDPPTPPAPGAGPMRNERMPGSPPAPNPADPKTTEE